MADYRRSAGLPALTVNWGPWADVGIAARSDYEQRFTLHGIGRIAPRQGLEILAHLLSQSRPRLAVIPVDWRRIGRAYPATARTPLLEEVLAAVPGGARPRASQGGAALRELLKGLAPPEQAERLRQYLRQQIANTLGTTADRIPVEQSLLNAGIDSLMAMELKNHIESELQVAIRIVDLLEGPTVDRLARMILDQMAARLLSGASTESKDDTTPP